MCEVLEVSRSGYYAWRTRPLGVRHGVDAALAESIREIYRKNRKVYGSPRIHDALKDQGIWPPEGGCGVTVISAFAAAKPDRRYTSSMAAASLSSAACENGVPSRTRSAG